MELESESLLHSRLLKLLFMLGPLPSGVDSPGGFEDGYLRDSRASGSYPNCTSLMRFLVRRSSNCIGLTEVSIYFFSRSIRKALVFFLSVSLIAEKRTL